ncbi:MAG TPA: DUF1800 domain-containing protein [Mycobacteriales bacterium]|nr:DUF1800 domain-containing protein [Mycobacteriales bacterium]
MAVGRSSLPPILGGSTGAVLSGVGSAPVSAVEAARLLAQATFGPTRTDIALVQRLGIAGWIDQQMKASATSHTTRYLQNSPADANQQTLRMEAWWWTALNAQDQLRQRVAFALSEIFVVSDLGAGLSDKATGMTTYYDLLVRGAFGSFRTLLEQVTLHPVMGSWLSLAGSCKADPAKGTHPDENYARELMQLFTVGTVLLNPDGTPVRRAGKEVPTYTQDQVSATARALTGWVPSSSGPWNEPMVANAAHHDTGTKRIIGGHLIPAGGSPGSDLAAVLDTLFAHPNVGPYICSLLIQRLVTSNPTPGYVGRVAAVFADDGTGVRGNLGAVVAAILLDDEARNGPSTVGGFGKVREPLLRITHLWRAFSGEGVGGRADFPHPEVVLGQAPLRAGSVFGFFSPQYAPTALARAGLVAPELQLADDASLPTVDDFVMRAIAKTAVVPTVVNKVLGLAGGQDLSTGGEHNVCIDISYESALSKNVTDLVDELSTVLMAGSLDATFRQQLEAYLATVPAGATRVTEAIAVLVTSPQYLVQR